MSAPAITANSWAGAPVAIRAGLGNYLLFTLRRNWVRAVVWFAVVAGLAGVIASYYEKIFGHDQAKLDDFAGIAQAPSMAALVGVISHPATLGGAIWCKGWMFTSLMLGIGMVYLMTRNLRGDEDAGRLELLRAYPLGLHSPLLSAVALTAVVSLVAGFGTAAVLIGFGIDTPGQGAGGSLAFGASVAAMGLLGVGIAALTNQLAPSGGAANGLGVGIFAVFYIVRMVGDLQSLPGLLWASPIGWGELVDPWTDNNWAPIGLTVLLAAVLVLVGWLVEARRDLGAGLVAPRPGAARASRLTTTVAGLAARTQRASLITWGVVMVIFGALLGSVVDKMRDLLDGLPGQAQAGLNDIVALLAAMLALGVSIFAVQSACTLRTEEEHGVAEAQLASGVSRLGWAGRRLLVTLVAAVALLVIGGAVMGAVWGQGSGDPSKLGLVLGALLAQLPGVVILAGIAVAGFGWWPKVAIPVVWGVVGALWAVILVKEALGLPDWVLKVLPFTGTPQVPAEPMDWAKEAIFAAVGIVLVVAGLAGFRRRDVPA